MCGFAIIRLMAAKKKTKTHQKISVLLEVPLYVEVQKKVLEESARAGQYVSMSEFCAGIVAQRLGYRFQFPAPAKGGWGTTRHSVDGATRKRKRSE
jgi:hypothetical protein